jgi:hypothetical protein
MVFWVWLALSFYILHVIESQDVIMEGELNYLLVIILLDYKAGNFFESHVIVFSGFHLDSGLEKEIGALQLEVSKCYRMMISFYSFAVRLDLTYLSSLQEKKLVAEIKRTAKTGNEVSCFNIDSPCCKKT